ncbi:MAG: CHAP domain-containing protein [Clostridia bacterium]|nr:CHAP domain-containing protein [Clostridia bacterium]
MNEIEKVISIAKEQVGNSAKKYREWYYGYNAQDVAWCAVFVSWCFAQAKIDMVKTDGAGCFAREGNGIYGIWYESEYSDRSTTPKIGDIVTFVWNYAGRYYQNDKYYSDHVGIVYAVDDNYIYTIEGNAGASNDTSTVKYKSYSRTSGAINGYFRPNYKVSESEENTMELQKGNKNNFVLAYKSLLIQAKTLGIVSQKVDESNSFGDGTYKATIEIQKKFNLDVDGIAGVQTITALRNAINKELSKIKTSKSDRNTVLDEVITTVDKMKV